MPADLTSGAVTVDAMVEPRFSKIKALSARLTKIDVALLYSQITLHNMQQLALLEFELSSKRTPD